MTKIIAFAGSYGANADLACKTFYPKYERLSCGSFADVFTAVKDEKAEYGIIPLENSYAGRVSEIHNLLQDSNLFIVAEHFHQIEHHLAGINGSKIADLKEIYSHPQALMQCKNNLSDIKAELKNYSNTADAAQLIKDTQDKSKAAICSKLAAKINNLTILKENLEDAQKNNMTLWIVLSKKAIDPDLKSK